MASNKCFKQDCEREVKYICNSSYLETYSCDLHLGIHLKSANRAHHFEPILFKPNEEINECGEIAKKEKLKKKPLVIDKDKCKKKLKRRNAEPDHASMSNWSKETIQNLENLKIMENTRSLQPETNSFEYDLIGEASLKKRKPKALDKESNQQIKKKNLLDFQLTSDVSKKWAIKFNQKQLNKTPLKGLNLQILNDKISTLSRQTINPETEQEFRQICSFFSSSKSISDPALKKAYKDYISAYHKATSIYHFGRLYSRTLYIYDTESEKESKKVLSTPLPLNYRTCITQLPNGELFCYGSGRPSGIAVIIDKNYNVRKMPNGLSCYNSSAIYFEKNIYCFGGDLGLNKLTLSARFDLYRNRWFKLTELPERDFSCHSVIFNGNIVICGTWNKYLLVYSVDIDSFSQIPYYLIMCTRKVLINTDRLYLIELERNCIHESEIGDEYIWKNIGISKLEYFSYQQYWTYNKGGIYILGNNEKRYWKFDFNKKNMKMLK